MPKIKILVADDEERIRALVSDFLKEEGYQVIEAEDGKKALDIFHKDKGISLVILDIMMPVFDGWTVCREIRQNNKQIPIVMLTARSEEADELYGFDLGVDEYISKPFSPLILVARIQALLRRVENNTNTIKSFNGLEVDESGYTARIDGKTADLSSKEFELLAYLISNQGITLSREKILDGVWGYDYFGDARTVDKYIKSLREKLEIKGDYIQTIRGVGYKFEVQA